MATYLNSTLIADPAIEISVSRRLIGNQMDALDGTDLLDYTAEKLVWALEWNKLSETDYNTIMTIVNNDALHTMAFVPPYTSTSYTVTIKRDTISETFYGYPTGDRYTIRFDVEAVR